MRYSVPFAMLSLFSSPTVAEVFLGQGTMSGEVTDTSVLLQTRLTSTTELDASDDIPGAAGVVCFQWSRDEGFEQSQRTSFQKASRRHDFIVRAALRGLSPGSKYYFPRCLRD